MRDFFALLFQSAFAWAMAYFFVFGVIGFYEDKRARSPERFWQHIAMPIAAWAAAILAGVRLVNCWRG